MLIKAQLVSKISEILEEQGLTQVKAAALPGIPQPKLSSMLRGQFRGLSERKLMDLVVFSLGACGSSTPVSSSGTSGSTGSGSGGTTGGSGGSSGSGGPTSGPGTPGAPVKADQSAGVATLLLNISGTSQGVNYDYVNVTSGKDATASMRRRSMPLDQGWRKPRKRWAGNPIKSPSEV